MKTKSILYLALVLLVVSCSKKTEQDTAPNSSLIEITKAQFESEGMTLGEPSQHAFPVLVYVTGSICPDVNGQAQLNVTIPGQVCKINYKPGDFVAKNAVVFEISGHAFIDLQKEYAESSAMLAKLKSDYDRVNELHSNDMASKKEFAIIESSFNAENARYVSLRLKLENLGVDVQKIEKGHFFSTFPVKSPISGFIVNYDVEIGKNVESMQKLAEVIDEQAYQIKLSVFEKDIARIKTNQKLSFYTNGNKAESHSAKIVSVGKTISETSKSIECYASIDNIKETHVVNNQYLEGNIYISDDSALSVPKTAILTAENINYVLVFVKNENDIYYFEKTKVMLGRTNNDFVEITSAIPSKKILTNGIYNLQIE